MACGECSWGDWYPLGHSVVVVSVGEQLTSACHLTLGFLWALLLMESVCLDPQHMFVAALPADIHGDKGHRQRQIAA